MKHLSKIILILTAISSVHAGTIYHDRTFLMPRSVGTNLALEYATWHKQFRAINEEDTLEGTIQFVPFFEQSESKTDIGRYFGIYNKQVEQLQDFSSVSNAANYIDNSYALHPLDVFHHAGSGNPYHPVCVPNPHHSGITSGNWKGRDFFIKKYQEIYTLRDRIKIDPFQETYGLRIDYHQKFDAFLKGLFFKLSMPIAIVKNKLGQKSLTCTDTKTRKQYKTIYSGHTIAPGIPDEDPEQPNEYPAKYDTYYTISGDPPSCCEYSFLDYLSGNYSNTDEHNYQEPLKYAKFHNGRKKAGIADAVLMLGYNFVYKETQRVNLAFELTIPMGNTPNGEYLFEPVVGNGHHWGIGTRFDSGFELWRDGENSFDFLFVIDYQYLLRNVQKRTLGFLGPNGETKSRWGQYVLAAEQGGQKMFPAANITTVDVKVTPGHRVDAMLSVAVNLTDWTFDLGYNLYAQEAETIRLKNKWVRHKYGVVQWDFDTKLAATFGSVKDDTTDKEESCEVAGFQTCDVCSACHNAAFNVIQPEDLLLWMVQTPTRITNKVFGSIGYTLNDWEMPLMFGIGTSYEFSSNNAALAKWAIWSKIGLTF